MIHYRDNIQTQKHIKSLSSTSVNQICWPECISEGKHEKDNSLSTGKGLIRFRVSQRRWCHCGHGQKRLKSNTIIRFSHSVDGKSKLKMSLGLNLDSISFQSHFLSLSLCFAAQETYIWKATPPFPRQHPLLTNRIYENFCGFTHTFTASHTHTHTSETCGTFTVQMNLSCNSDLKIHQLN